MDTIKSKQAAATDGTEIDQFLATVPPKAAICDRLDAIEREKKKLKKLLRIAHAAEAGEVSPC